LIEFLPVFSVKIAEIRSCMGYENSKFQRILRVFMLDRWSRREHEAVSTRIFIEFFIAFLA